MLYPVYVHPGDGNQAHGVNIQDFSRCFAAADRWEDLPARLQDAVEVYCEGEAMDIPDPTPWETLASQPDYQGGIWQLAGLFR